MEKEERILINDKVNVDRLTAYDALPDAIKEYSDRVAYNSKLLFAELLKRKVYADYNDLNRDNLNIVYEAIRYFDIGLAFKLEGIKSEKVLPIKHVTIGGDVFFSDIKSRDDFKALSSYEKKFRFFAKDAATYHHERWDGKGYPLGLKMEEIPISARICTICFAFEQLTNGTTVNMVDRYSAIKEIKALSGIQFDPQLVDVMVDILPILAVKGEVYSFDDMFVFEEEQADKPKEEETEESKDQIDLPKEEEKPNADKELEKVAEVIKPKRKASRPIELLFSPVKDIKTNNVLYYKSTLVINDRYYGAMKPVLYANIAEKTGKMIELSMIGISQAIEFIELVELYNIKHDGLFYKLYPSIVEKERNLLKIINAVKKSAIDPKNLIFEISETTMASDDEKVKKNIALIKQHGFRIAICEFGEEYSSLSKLGDLDFDFLMIGHKFIKNITTSSRTSGVVRSLADLVKNIGAEEICENVRSMEQLEVLKKIGCRRVEGPIVGELQSYKEIIS